MTFGGGAFVWAGRGRVKLRLMKAAVSAPAIGRSNVNRTGMLDDLS